MTGVQFFALAATIYLAPKLSDRAAWAMVAICLLASVICKIGETA